MEANGQELVSEELQKVLLSTNLSLLKSTLDEKDENHERSIGKEYEEELELDDHTLNRWTPLLRSAIEHESLSVVMEELYTSIETNFENLESQILHDSQLSDNLTVSVDHITSIKELIDQSLLREVEDLQLQLAHTTNDVITRKQNYINNKKTSTKIAECIILINKILQILELSNKCQDLIKDGSYFKALQSLGGLEKIYVQDFKNYNFDFLKTIYASISDLKAKIKDESINMVKNSFNSNLERRLLPVGSKYYDFYKDNLFQKWQTSKHEMKLASFKFNSPVEISLRDSGKLDTLNVSEIYPLNEFYDCILIFQNLKAMDYLCTEFRKEYDFRMSKVVYPLKLKGHNSSKKADQILQVAAAFGENLTLVELKAYLLRILGFVIYDNHLNRSTEILRSFGGMGINEDFWELFVTRFTPFLEYYVTKSVSSEDGLIELKDFLGIYIAILENLNVNVDQINKIHVLLFKKYAALLLQVFDVEFSTLLDDDDFMPLTINDKTLYEKVLKICWLRGGEPDHVLDEESNHGPFFATLPFSPLYPMSCTLIKKTYNKLITFLSEFYRYDLGELNQIIIQTIDDIFSKVINHKIGSKLDTTSREEITQILINLDYFIVAAKEFGAILSRENITQNPDLELTLPSLKLLTQSRNLSETKLIELIDTKISDLMEFVEFEWSSEEVEQEPSFSIRDIAQFLEMMFTSTLVNLPDSVKTLLIFREFDALTGRFLDVLLYSSPPMLSPQSVLNFELNMNFLESVISKLFPHEESFPSVPSSPDLDGAHTSDNARSSNLVDNTIRSLHSTFTDLRQHISFLKSPDIDEYKDPSIRMRKYPRIKPETAQLLHKKMVPPVSAGADSVNSSSMDQSFADSISSHKRIAKFFNRA
ncbi:LADA_0G15940g1_1 [Lachancea dasiensis]|uniref:Exocyst complex component SEC15 n=1 Tax=Lachancea dasiensis TaxID=1072105 RepID=A0A1G4JWS0_9SACH|nr:LADA_0G15940g1_1 [Lachancea dasiensis]